MAGDSDAKLTGLTAEILRDAVQVFDHEDLSSWLVAARFMGAVGGGQVTGSFPALTGAIPVLTGAMPAATGAMANVTGAMASVTGSFPALTGAFATITGSFPAVGGGVTAGPGLKAVFKLPRKLPGIRLPATARLAELARSAPLMAELEALAAWLGRDGRLVTADNGLPTAEMADSEPRLHVQRQRLPYLLDYALTAGWVKLKGEPGGNRTWAVLGNTAWRWADGDDSGALHVWGAVFAALLARTLDVAASADPRASRKLKFQGRGVAAAVTLFLAGRPGLSTADVSDLVMRGTIGDRSSSRARREWDSWVSGHGDPAHWLLNELTALGAVRPTGAADGSVELTPLARWALREQLRLDGVEIPLLKATSAQMSAAALVTFADGADGAEAAAEFASWLGARGPGLAGDELLAFAAVSGPKPRLTAVNLVRRIGPAAQSAWLNAMQRPELRGYARIALAVLAADLPQSAIRPVPNPDPGDLARVATDLLALACGDATPDPQEVAAQFSEAIPEGAETWVLGLMSQNSDPAVAKVLMVLARCHPDRRIAKGAKRAARGAVRNQMAARADRVPARAFGR